MSIINATATTRTRPILLLVVAVLCGCSAQPPLSDIVYARDKAIYPLDHYTPHKTVDNISVAMVPYAPGHNIYADPQPPPQPSVEIEADTETRTDSDTHNGHGLNVLEAGVQPLRLIVLQQGNGEILLDPEHITGVAGNIRYQTYTAAQAIDLVLQSDVFREAIKGSHVRPLLRSILGGEVLVAAVKGGVKGIASGGIVGGTSGVAKGAAGAGMERAYGYEKALRQLITREYNDQALKRQTLYPGYHTDGLIFLPSQKGITRIDIPAYDMQTKKAVLISLELQ